MKKIILLSGIFIANFLNAQDTFNDDASEGGAASYTCCECYTDKSTENLINDIWTNGDHSTYDIRLRREVCPTPTTGVCDDKYKCAVWISKYKRSNNALVYSSSFTGTCTQVTIGTSSDNEMKMQRGPGFNYYTYNNAAVIKHDIYPNPASDAITVTNAKNIDLLEVLGIDGKVLIQQNNDSKNNTVKINTGQLNNGIYFVRTMAGADVQFTKVVISRN